MAKKSKSQRAKASARRAARREEAREAEARAAVAEAEPEPQKSKLDAFLSKTPLRSKETAEERMEREQYEKEEKAREEKEKAARKKEKKKNRFRFIKETIAELKRVTWPSKQDVARWSVVVVGALVFFGVYVLVLDNGIITPILYFISGLGA